jgi:hypothetical protein
MVQGPAEVFGSRQTRVWTTMSFSSANLTSCLLCSLPIRCPLLFVGASPCIVRLPVSATDFFFTTTCLLLFAIHLAPTSILMQS